MTFNDFPCIMRFMRIYLYYLYSRPPARNNRCIGSRVGHVLDTGLHFLTFKISRLSFLL